MREILFRGINAVTKEWIIGNLFQRDEQAFIMADNYVTEVIPETVGQFTGLTDRNGKRIFEGDICKTKNQLGESIIVVKYGVFRPEFFYDCAENCGYNIKNNLFGLYAESVDGEKIIFPDNVRYAEVIGNVHDDPELIGGDENAKT